MCACMCLTEYVIISKRKGTAGRASVERGKQKIRIIMNDEDVLV